jgi:predicted RNA binding protein YcfA (HicA-like mRNA interferase family)
MSSAVPRISGKKAVGAFKKAGFVLDRITGSHHILKKDGHPYCLSIPVHGNRTVGRGLLSAQIEAAGLTLAEFRALL